jgi:hypothetical protein
VAQRSRSSIRAPRGPQADRTPDDTAVATAIRKVNGRGLDDGGQKLPALLALPAPHLEHVREVGSDEEMDPVVDRPDEEVREREPLDEYILEQKLAPKVDGMLWVPGIPPELVVRHGQVYLGAIRLDDLGRELCRWTAGRLQLVVTENARILVEQPEGAVAWWRHVAVLVDEQEEPVVLECERVGHRRLPITGNRRVPDGFGHRDHSSVSRLRTRLGDLIGDGVSGCHGLLVASLRHHLGVGSVTGLRRCARRANAFVQRDVIVHHAVGAESLDGALTTSDAVERVDGPAGSNELDHVLGRCRDETRQSILDQLAHTSPRERHDRASGQHGFDQNEPERLVPFDRGEQRSRMSEQ